MQAQAFYRSLKKQGDEKRELEVPLMKSVAHAEEQHRLLGFINMKVENESSHGLRSTVTFGQGPSITEIPSPGSSQLTEAFGYNTKVIRVQIRLFFSMSEWIWNSGPVIESSIPIFSPGTITKAWRNLTSKKIRNIESLVTPHKDIEMNV
ncbi:hypothetical protein FRC00_013070 [Tulasnella sp. 408]|nr:hypothetical protein FRC00_013070 [Tulasnella sp. 408]